MYIMILKLYIYCLVCVGVIYEPTSKIRWLLIRTALAPEADQKPFPCADHRLEGGFCAFRVSCVSSTVSFFPCDEANQ